MGEIADEVPADGLKLTNARQVLQNQQTPARCVLVGDDHQLQEVSPPGMLRSFNLHFIEFLAALPGLDKLVIPQHLGDGAIYQPGTKQLLGGGIGKLNSGLRTRDQNGIRHLVEHCRKAGPVRIDIG